MALTPDDVVHKEFQHVRFKDGLDPDEVDDYLDEIVVEWRKAIEENTVLRMRIAQLEAAGMTGGSMAPISAIPSAGPVIGGDDSTGIIAVAQRVHDEYIAEGQSRGRQVVADAEARATQILSQAEAHHRAEMARLSRERESLTREVSELREFENSYRKQLRGYFEGQLRQLDAPNPTAGSVASSLGL